MNILTTETLPVIFAGLMALSVLMYVILDGFDLGVGMLLPFTQEKSERDIMVTSIGPFWDANGTWLVLGIGILLIAFPRAYGIILGELYLPVAFMLIGLILRGCAFDFRVKAQERHQSLWDNIFIFGSFLASFMQGIMIGRFITGFSSGYIEWGFAIITGIGLCFTYMLIGASWILMKIKGEIQLKSIKWIQWSLLLVAFSIIIISFATTIASREVAEKWFIFPNFFIIAILPIGCTYLFWIIYQYARKFTLTENENNSWIPFACCVGILLFSYLGLAYSIFPYILLGSMTIWENTADIESLKFVFWGAIIVLPIILLYTTYIHYVFRKKLIQKSPN